MKNPAEGYNVRVTIRVARKALQGEKSDKRCFRT